MESPQDLLDYILRESTVEIHFQPVFDLKTQSILGYEALSRGPKNTSLYSPLCLFSTARQYGRIYELDELCRKQAIKTFHSRSLNGKLFLNINPNILLKTFPEHNLFLTSIAAAGIKPSQVVFELTEDEQVNDISSLLDVLKPYRAQGVLIAIDDFGSGYSNLKLWSEIAPDFVKIDRHFVERCNESDIKQVFLKSIISLAKDSGCQIIAEGIEQVDELNTLQQLGISYAQGFLLAFPKASPCCHFPEQLKAASIRAKPTHAVTKQVGWLAKKGLAISDQTYSLKAQQLFEKNKGLLSLAVIDKAGYPIGLLYKDQLTEVFASPYGHALFDKKPVLELMDKHPLIVDEQEDLDAVSQLITEQEFDIRRHIIITRESQYLGLAPLRDILKHITEQKIRHAQHANPLTMLPGNIAINDAIEQRVASQLPFHVAYFDLNHFKQFNDVYGYSCGDSAIKLLANILVECCKAYHCFIGHIGGDDFMVVFDCTNAEQICQAIIAHFDRQVLDLFSEEHQDEKGYWAFNREGRKQFTPLLSLSVGLVYFEKNGHQNVHQISAMATEAKKEAKKKVVSYLHVFSAVKPAISTRYLDSVTT